MSRADILAPWDALPYFQPVTGGSFFIGFTPVLIAEADPNRVALIISTDSSTNFTVSPASVFGFGSGYVLNQTNNTWTITHREHGNLAQIPLFAISQMGAGAILSTIEIRLAKWPSRR